MTDTPRPPTYDDIRALVHSKGADLDNARPAPRGVAGAQHERWMTGHAYNPPRPNVDTPTPKRTRVEVKGRIPTPTPDHLPPTSTSTQPAAKPTPPRTSSVAREVAGVERIAAKLRAEGITSARVSIDHAGRPAVETDPIHRDKAAKLLGRWTMGQT